MLKIIVINRLEKLFIFVILISLKKFVNVGFFSWLNTYCKKYNYMEYIKREQSPKNRFFRAFYLLRVVRTSFTHYLTIFLTWLNLCYEKNTLKALFYRYLTHVLTKYATWLNLSILSA